MNSGSVYVAGSIVNNGQFTCRANNTIYDFNLRPFNQPSINGTSSNITINYGASIVIAAPVGYATYRWSTGATTRWIVVTASGLYSVTTSDSGSCYATSDSTRITVLPLSTTNEVTTGATSSVITTEYSTTSEKPMITTNENSVTTYSITTDSVTTSVAGQSLSVIYITFLKL